MRPTHEIPGIFLSGVARSVRRFSKPGFHPYIGLVALGVYAGMSAVEPTVFLEYVRFSVRYWARHVGYMRWKVYAHVDLQC